MAKTTRIRPKNGINSLRHVALLGILCCLVFEALASLVFLERQTENELTFFVNVTGTSLRFDNCHDKISPPPLQCDLLSAKISR